MEQQHLSVAVIIVPNGSQAPAGKLASAELVFAGEPLDGLRLTGFGIWVRDGGGRNVTFPARQYVANGQPRVFPLLQTTREGAPQRLRQLILTAYTAFEARRRPAADEFPDLPRPE